jgi:hypothetical protein
MLETAATFRTGGEIQPDLNSFGKKICIYGHTGL